MQDAGLAAQIGPSSEISAAIGSISASFIADPSTLTEAALSAAYRQPLRERTTALGGTDNKSFTIERHTNTTSFSAYFGYDNFKWAVIKGIQRLRKRRASPNASVLGLSLIQLSRDEGQRHHEWLRLVDNKSAPSRSVAHQWDIDAQLGATS